MWKLFPYTCTVRRTHIGLTFTNCLLNLIRFARHESGFISNTQHVDYERKTCYGFCAIFIQVTRCVRRNTRDYFHFACFSLSFVAIAYSCNRQNSQSHFDLLNGPFTFGFVELANDLTQSTFKSNTQFSNMLGNTFNLKYNIHFELQEWIVGHCCHWAV